MKLNVFHMAPRCISRIFKKIILVKRKYDTTSAFLKIYDRKFLGLHQKNHVVGVRTFVQFYGRRPALNKSEGPIWSRLFLCKEQDIGMIWLRVPTVKWSMLEERFAASNHLFNKYLILCIFRVANRLTVPSSEPTNKFSREIQLQKVCKLRYSWLLVSIICFTID